MHPRGSSGRLLRRSRPLGDGDGRGVRALDRARAAHRRHHFGRRLRRHDAGDGRHARAAGRHSEDHGLDRRRRRRRAPMSARADIMMFHSVADVQGLNSITEQVLANAAHALAGMIAQLPTREACEARRKIARPALGITMFGVTTPCVQAVTRRLEADYDCLVFHATGIGGRAMEALGDSGCSPASSTSPPPRSPTCSSAASCRPTEDRFGAADPHRPALCRLGRRARHGQFRSARHRAGEIQRPQIRHPQSERHADAHDARREPRRSANGSASGSTRWTARCASCCRRAACRCSTRRARRSMIPEADEALFEAIEKTVRPTGQRQVERVRANINEPAFRRRGGRGVPAPSSPVQRRA